MKKMKLNILGILLIATAIFTASCEKHDMDEPGLLVPKTVDQDANLPSIKVNGTLLHSEAFGNPDDPILLVLHGGPGGDYRGLLNCKDFVDDGYYVVFYDQRGSGLSQRHDDEEIYTVPNYMDDLDAVIKHYRGDEDQQLIILGHSWGGMLGAGYISLYPEVVDGLIMAEAGGLTYDQMIDYVERQNKVDYFAEATNDAIFPEQIFAGRSEHEILDYKHMFWTQYENAEGNKTGNEGTAPYWRSGAVAYSGSHKYASDHGFDFTTNLNNYNKPVLFIYSELNEAFGKEWAEEVAAPFPNKKIQIVNGAGHEMVYWGWDDMYPKVLNYLNELNQTNN